GSSSSSIKNIRVPSPSKRRIDINDSIQNLTHSPFRRASYSTAIERIHSQTRDHTGIAQIPQSDAEPSLQTHHDQKRTPTHSCSQPLLNRTKLTDEQKSTTTSRTKISFIPHQLSYDATIPEMSKRKNIKSDGIIPAVGQNKTEDSVNNEEVSRRTSSNKDVKSSSEAVADGFIAARTDRVGESSNKIGKEQTSSQAEISNSEDSIEPPPELSSTSSATAKVDEFLISLCESVTPIERGRCGIVNIGNTCFMNSALQCLSNIADLTLYILKNRGFEKDLNMTNLLGTEGKVARAYANLIQEMWSGTKSSVSASSVKQYVGDLCPRFAGFNQQDSHEFLNVLLDGLHEDLKREDMSDAVNDETSVISDIFHCKLRSTVRCFECPIIFESDESMSFLSLPVSKNASQSIDRESCPRKGSSKSSIPLKKCFEGLFKSEILSKNGKWFCNNCNRLTEATKKLDLWTVPKVLILQLKRFTYDLSNNTKIETLVDYPLDSLNLSDFVTNTDYDQNIRFDLIATSCHSGSLAGGHYTAYARNFLSNNWLHFNDHCVREAIIRDLVTANAYLLIYRQREG
ncbi:unnamed protein product, partial [Rotaria sp. Silwood2]